MSDIAVYIGTYTTDPNGEIHHYRLDTATGALTPSGVTRGVPDPFFLIVNAAGDRLYASNGVDDIDGREQAAVSAFAIGEGGSLSFLNRQPCRGTLPCYLSLDNGERHLLVGNYNSGSVAVLPIESDGSLAAPSDSHQHAGSGPNHRQEGPHVHAIVLDPSGQWVYAPDLGIDKVMLYRFDATTGHLTPKDPAFISSVAGAGPRHFAFHPNGRIAYLLNELNATFNVYQFDADTGDLTEIQSISMLPEGFIGSNYAADVQILASGKFLYGSNRGADNIAIFAIDDDSGKLTAAGHADAGGSWPWNLAIDPTSRFLLATNYESDKVVVFEIHAESGDLTPTGHEVSVAKPVNVIIAPQVG